MSFGSIRTEILLSTAIEEFKSLGGQEFSGEFFPRTLSLINEDYPELNDKQKVSILAMILDALNHDSQEKVELVATAPASFTLKTKRTQNAVHALLQEAKKSIFITGYSVSDFISEFVDEIVSKSQKGVFVKIYINNVEKQVAIDKLLRYRSKFLQIYDYKSKDDKMAALHAKVISIDSCKSLISSANLSYHGLSGNIEIGSLIYSERIARQLDELFKQLVFQKVFTSLN